MIEIENIKREIAKNEAESRQIGRQIQALREQGPQTGPERSDLRLARRALGYETRGWLQALALCRGRGRWLGEKAQSYPCYESLHRKLVQAGSSRTEDEARFWAEGDPTSAAAALTAWVSGLPEKERNEAIKGADAQVRAAYHEARQKAMFAEDKIDRSKAVVHKSPSGRYDLIVTPVSTRPGCGSYALGEVFKGPCLLARVERNDSSFPFLFIEGHPDGHDYLICGEDYQGQTVIQLDTGERRDHLPPEAKKGWGFCWSGITFAKETKVLVVDGCVWACPYEYRLYDFSRPMNGWRDITGDVMIDADGRPPTFEPDGTVKVYQSGEAVEDDQGNKTPGPVVATTTFRNERGRLVQQDAWVSEEEQARREASALARKKHDEWYESFKATDPLYLRLVAGLTEPFKPSKYNGLGVTYKGWCPDWDVEERRWCKDVHETRALRIAIEWGIVAAPIKLALSNLTAGGTEVFWFEHSLAGMDLALARARQALPPVHETSEPVEDAP
jgi:hypothetical protein